eukprot:CAMPEP_0202887692 /NCGR_PEP_ID=MMETSP1391-20130828/42813_1 /ASSEMBLY_ACC=CAM_ASM_000867 /TAXON_ID=1034604 /ORGANISM="Chlamydomonas leiostraca, Strain SAG 11-49" /LENGTH=84 /DNA_ID=CAMNT_0049570987 /DNA_START=840 /DNA_END=1091 /DNA_ORIENTATION=+
MTCERSAPMHKAWPVPHPCARILVSALAVGARGALAAVGGGGLSCLLSCLGLRASLNLAPRRRHVLAQCLIIGMVSDIEQLLKG